MLDAAERVFAESSFAAASMEQIAIDSGITKALIYQYFGSKERLYVACVERSRRELFDRMEEAAAEAEGPVARLNLLTSIYLENLIALKGRPILLYGDAPVEAVDEMRERNAQALTRILAIDFPEVEPAELEMAANLIVGAGEQVGRWWTRNPEVPVSSVWPRFAGMVGAALFALGRS
jgi:AcrR family transcriptional regulator